MEPGSLPLSTAATSHAPASALSPVDSRARLLAIATAFIKYVVVGGAAFVVDFGLFSLCISGGMHYLIAVTLGFCAGLITNYMLCVLWVWRGTQARTLRDIAVFTLVGLGGLALTWLGMWICVELLHWPERPSKVLLAAAVLVWNFSLRRLFVFFR
ncbi:GtrA family protein [Uliginosibacterium sp. H3]|uniref:GtrA family protein n=1 Tax=Uliginosibacterium silvisoli TaxID=3114758 RepID=A0ABU6K0B9_9RHOO|nr:GtrA family protein [Uliginosibacterium sp. H3]